MIFSRIAYIVRFGIRTIRIWLLVGALVGFITGCGSAGSHSNRSLLGTWLPPTSSNDGWGFVFEENGKGTLTSRSMLEKYPNYRAPFEYRATDTDMSIKILGEEGNGVWVDTPYHVKGTNLIIDSPPHPVSDKSFERVLK